MLLETRAETLVTTWLWLTHFNAATDEVSTACLNAPVVEGKGTNEDGHLEEEVYNDSESCHQAEVL